MGFFSPFIVFAFNKRLMGGVCTGDLRIPCGISSVSSSGTLAEPDASGEAFLGAKLRRGRFGGFKLRRLGLWSQMGFGMMGVRGVALSAFMGFC